MRAGLCGLFFALVLLVGSSVRADEKQPGWLGVQTENLSKEDADRLGWEAPRGAKEASQAHRARL